MQTKNLEWKVGLFVLAGFAIVAGLILYFGKFGERGDYELIVRFENASGLINGSKILYAGVEVGKVKEINLDPQGHYVDVVLGMFRFKKWKYIIKKDAIFTIKQSGLLGDVYVTIEPGSPGAPEAQPGEILRGKQPTSVSEMAESADELLRKLNESVDKLSKGLLDEATLGDLRGSVKNLKELSGNMNMTSLKLNQTLNDLNKGEGTIGKLFQNDEIFENFRALSYNLRKRGIFGYKDVYSEEKNKTPEEKEEQKQEERKKLFMPKSR
jgi:phospholipid/cholesterol/gamma-HCH transport system substrate-binding protein